MTSRSDLSQAPPNGEREWPNNGEIYERLRVSLLEQAERAEAAGDVALADDLRARAALQRKERDRCFREYERRVLNRRVRHGLF